MAKTVYCVKDEGVTLNRLLTEKGYKLIIGKEVLLDDALAECDVLVPGVAFITDDVLKKAPHLGFVTKLNVGVDRIDIDACSKRGIYVANTPGTNAISVAEHTAAMIAASAKKLCQTYMYLHSDDYIWKNARVYTTELYGKTLSLIGFGNIGKRVAEIMHGFGMKIMVYGHHVDPNSVPYKITVTDNLDEALAAGDFVSIHVSGRADNEKFIGAKEFDKMKPTAVFLNTTRGFVVDEAALIEALQKGKIAGAALDTLEQEPTDPKNPLLKMSNVIITPHHASWTRETRERAQLACFENIEQFFAGQIPERALNKEAIRRN